MGKYTDLSFGINKKINSMISLGMKKAEMVELIHQKYLEEEKATEKDWQENKTMIIQKNEYLRSCGSIEVMRSASRPFIDFMKNELGIKKFEKVEREHLELYLKYRYEKGYSAYTISRDLHFVNKLWNENITKKELGLPSRKVKEIKKSRSGLAKDRPGLLDKCRDEITFITACGMRRDSVNRIKKSDISFNDKGEPYKIHLKEKNGLERDAWILLEYRPQLMEILRNVPNDREIFPGQLDKHLGTHYLRHEYALKLITELEKGQDSAYYKEMGKRGRISAYDKTHYPDGKYKGYDLKLICEVSANLGHGRAEVIKHYLY